MPCARSQWHNKVPHASRASPPPIALLGDDLQNSTVQTCATKPLTWMDFCETDQLHAESESSVRACGRKCGVA